MPLHIDQGAISAYLQVIVVNILLSGDNVIVIGMAAAGLDNRLRNKAIAAGITAAAIIRILFALVAVRLLDITGITLVGGLLLLWVCWTMLKELRVADEEEAADLTPGACGVVAMGSKLFRQAITQIIVADVSMSLDNVLAVAGAAERNMGALIFGLVLSVLLMGLASSFIAMLLSRYRWIGWVGLVVILYVAIGMIYRGGEQLLPLVTAL
ncbi:YjbE family putative metal transport protein [Rhizobium mayense]|uniref:YjbE family putative metal transport protein n=1 Tax=Rhizobium mayense TaxID=1312184 RepID=A0ABT7K088_9HYPH|nr:YjbE family putative metal transport protein [Rhizobium mayense]MDL2402010.1 YjbE family putative metal transport protein [Rhizobium mayense]